MSDFSNKVEVSIAGSNFIFWKKMQLMRSIDSQWTVEINAPFNENDEEFRFRFEPFKFQPFNVSVNKTPVLTGTTVPIVPDLVPNASTVTVGAYSLPGVMGDCTLPVDYLPSLEFKGLNLHEIANQLAEVWDIVVTAETDPGPIFKKVALKPHEKPLKFLTKLAKTRGQLISTNAIGELVFYQAVESGDPVALLEQGSGPLKKITPVFNFSEYYSEITGIQPIRVRARKSVKYTEKNTLLADVVRPLVFKVDQARDGDLQTAVKWKIGRMFANMVTYTLEVATWKDHKGNYWEPNTIVRVRAPGAMIYDYYNLVIRDVTLNKNEKSETAVLTTMLPGSYTGNAPGKLPWER